MYIFSRHGPKQQMLQNSEVCPFKLHPRKRNYSCSSASKSSYDSEKLQPFTSVACPTYTVTFPHKDKDGTLGFSFRSILIIG